LCIIQDDSEDKNIEISRMGSIYKNATLTIAAANTTRVQDSFLTPRPVPRSCTLPYLLPDGSLGTLWIKDGNPDWLVGHLDSRAWALQESLLSPRVLWYGPADLKWKCKVAEFANVWKNHTHDFNYPLTKGKRLPQSIFGLPEKRVDNIEALRSELWNGIMEDYSGRDITFAEDRLPALAGVASELQKVWDDGYLAGMWRSQLIRQLGWYNATDATIKPSPETDSTYSHLPATDQYQSPGWTWTSYKGRVAVYEVLKEHAEILDCHVTPVDKNLPFSRVTSGKLVLNASCITEEERLVSNPDDSWFKWDYNHCVEQDHINDTFLYALLGETQYLKSLALVLAPAGDGTFMRIGILFNFNVGKWKSESMVKREITII